MHIFNYYLYYFYEFFHFCNFYICYYFIILKVIKKKLKWLKKKRLEGIQIDNINIYKFSLYYTSISYHGLILYIMYTEFVLKSTNLYAWYKFNCGTLCIFNCISSFSLSLSAGVFLKIERVSHLYHSHTYVSIASLTSSISLYYNSHCAKYSSIICVESLL